jgi:hypothetical protein
VQLEKRAAKKKGTVLLLVAMAPMVVVVGVVFSKSGINSKARSEPSNA